MKKIMQTVMSFVVAFAMIGTPMIDAQTRGRQAQRTTSNSGGSHRAPSASRPGNSHGNGQRPGSNGNHRPSTPGQGTHRPGNGTNNNRPGNGSRPGNYRPGNDWNRPGAGGSHGMNRPGGQYRPAHGVPHRPMRPTPPPPPRRHPAHFHHHVPFFGSYHRPVPPPRWHYRSGGPVFSTILGVALGTAIGASINALVNNGYTVSSYGNDVIYLSNVPQMNYTWPDAALYYSNGILTGSQFTYPSPYYDMSRYNNLYNVFTAQYGMPVQTVNQGGIMSATWYGPSNRFVTLSFNSQYGGNFYTTLSFGN